MNVFGVLSRIEAAKLLGISLRFLDQLLKRGEIPSRKVGRRVLISRVALEAWVSGVDVRRKEA